MKTQCAMCGGDQPQQRYTTGSPIEDPTWVRHGTGAIVCGPLCAGRYEKKHGLMRFDWIPYNPEEPST